MVDDLSSSWSRENAQHLDLLLFIFAEMSFQEEQEVADGLDHTSNVLRTLQDPTS